MVTILVGKSATGKDAILRYLVNTYKYEPIVSITSRPKRVGEVDGREYNFISYKEFKLLIKNDKLIEYRSYNTLVDNKPEIWYYGLKKQHFDNDKNYAVILDIDGAKNFINYIGKKNCVVYYINTKDEIRKIRAMKRGSFDEIEWNRRLEDDNKVFNENALDDINAFTIRNNQCMLSTICDIINNNNLTITIHYYLDFDGVIAQSCNSVCNILNAKYGERYSAEDVTTWNFSNCYGELNDNTIEDIFDSEIFFNNLEFYDGVKDFILRNSNRITIVTKGREKNLELKKQWLKENGLGDIEFIGIPLHISKSVVDMSNNGMFIDDSVNNLKESNATYKILFKEFDNDAEWQRNWDGLIINNWKSYKSE